MFKYDPEAARILAAERLLLKLKREHETVHGPDSPYCSTLPESDPPETYAAHVAAPLACPSPLIP